MTARFLAIDDLSVSYGATPVLNDVSLEIGQGEFVALLGSSGCGKTTLLRTIAGFVKPRRGRLYADGRDITHLPPDKRGMALVFQSYALWPHMSVRKNIGYGLRLRGIARQAIDQKVDGLLAMLGLEGLGERAVTALSGGQRQRVALGRALAIDPKILLLDEPLSNLDARIRQTVRHEIRALQRRLGITAIHVTHDREEAMVMADRIVILNDGRIEQQAPPETVYNQPATAFVADFMGADNRLEVEGVVETDAVAVRAGGHHAAGRLPLARMPWRHAVQPGEKRRFQAHFRSEGATILAPAQAEAAAGTTGLRLAGRVLHVAYPGGLWRHVVKVGSREFLIDAGQPYEPGADVALHLAADAVFLFPDESSGERADSNTTAPLPLEARA